MRDYAGSTPFSSDELAALSDSSAEVQTVALRAQAVEIAIFLDYFVASNDIPQVAERDGKRSGGIVLLTWSLSNVLAFGLLAEAASLPEETRAVLNDYLQTIILFGIIL